MGKREERLLGARLERLRARSRKAEEKLLALKGQNLAYEKRLREARDLLGNAPGGLVLVQEGKILYASDAIKAQMGEGDGGILGRHFLEFVHPDSVAFVKAIHQRRTSGKTAPRVYETYLMAKGGRSVCCEVRVKKIRYRGRSAYLLMLLGVGQRRRRERQLIRTQKMEAISRMASGLGQELDQCLQLVANVPVSESIDGPAPVDRMKRWLKQVDLAREMGQSIARQLEVLGRGFADRPKGAILDLRKIVRASVAEVRSRFKDDAGGRDTGIQLRTYLRELSPVRGHPEEVKNAISHIIRNAVDALPGTGEVYVTTEMGSGFAQVYIQDNGDGIPEEMQDRIFDPFFTTREGRRLGLGLSLASAVIFQNGGEIEVLKHKERGSTFIIRFPLAPSSPAGRPGRKSPGKRIGDAQFLIIADEGIVTDLLIRWLSGKGATVTSAASESEGLSLLNKNRYDMAFLLKNIPHIRPSRIVPKIKEVQRGLPVALVGRAGNRAGCGADLVFGTPLCMDRVLARVQQALARGGSPR